MNEAVLALIDMVEALTKRVEALEAQKVMVDTLCDELSAVLDRVQAPVIVDSDGVIQMTQDALVADVDARMKEAKEMVASLQRQFHQHLADHEVNGAGPASIHPDRFREIVDEIEKTSLRL